MNNLNIFPAINLFVTIRAVKEKRNMFSRSCETTFPAKLLLTLTAIAVISKQNSVSGGAQYAYQIHIWM